MRAGLIPATKVLDLKGRFRCRGCGGKGRAAVSVQWAHQSPRTHPPRTAAGR